MLKIYNVRYCVDKRGVEARTGILSNNQRITRVRYEDIRSLDTHQSLLDRFLDIGQVEVSTAASSAVEMVLAGIAVPEDVKRMLERERDKRQKNLAKLGKNEDPIVTPRAQAS